jgi:hypothetical protein
MHRLRPALIPVVLAVLGLATAPACAPAPSYPVGPGAISYSVSQDGVTVDSGGGAVNWVFGHSGTSTGVSFCSGGKPTAFWTGSMTTQDGFEGTAGKWVATFGYDHGYLGYCGPTTVRLVDPDGVVQLDNATFFPNYTSNDCGDEQGIRLDGTAPLASDPTLTATVSFVICVPDVASSFGQGF